MRIISGRCFCFFLGMLAAVLIMELLADSSAFAPEETDASAARRTLAVDFTPAHAQKTQATAGGAWVTI